MFSAKVLTFLTFLALAVVANAFRNCPALKPVPISQKFLFDDQPSGGFYAAATSGEDTLPKYTPKTVPPAKGTNKVCFKAEFMINGRKKISPPVSCVYDTPSEITCDPSTATGATTAAAATGQRVPKVITSYIVDTDNKTFLAVGLCVEGTVYQWSILTTESSNRHVHASTLKALHINEKEITEAQGKKMKPGRAGLTKGECLKIPKMADTKAQLTKAQDELSSLGTGLLQG